MSHCWAKTSPTSFQVVFSSATSNQPLQCASKSSCHLCFGWLRRHRPFAGTTFAQRSFTTYVTHPIPYEPSNLFTYVSNACFRAQRGGQCVFCLIFYTQNAVLHYSMAYSKVFLTGIVLHRFVRWGVKVVEPTWSISVVIQSPPGLLL